jgi:hypothetical protein
MVLRSRQALLFHQSRSAVSCARCGETLFAAEWAEYLEDGRIRYLWSCDACDHEFESAARYPELDGPNQTSEQPELRLIA